jgi:hypothetical protein
MKEKPAIMLTFAFTCAALLVVAGSLASGDTPGRWVRVLEHAPFSPRDTAEPFVFDGKMWLSNGWEGDDTKVNRDLWWSTDGVTWTQALDETPYEGYSEIVVYRGKVWAIKGSVWNSSDCLHWTKVCDKTPLGSFTPAGSAYAEAVVHDGKIWYLGASDAVWCTTDGANWERVLEHAPYGPRLAAGVVSFGGKLWVIGGSTAERSDPPEEVYPNTTTHNDVWCSAGGRNWTRVISHAPWQRRMWTVATVYAGRIWLLGGFANWERKNFAEAWYSRDGANWFKYDGGPMWAPRHETAPFAYDGSLWVVGGNTWPLVNDVWRLTLTDAGGK